MRVLDWNEFNICVETTSILYKKKDFCGVYGFPRGGLCLAVALSHSLNIPFLQKPKPGSLIVDDVYQTGSTLKRVRHIPGTTTFVWLSKVKPVWWDTLEVCDPAEWLVFPWENMKFAQQDKKVYKHSRRLMQ